MVGVKVTLPVEVGQGEWVVEKVVVVETDGVTVPVNVKLGLSVAD